jgi:hypothetical protein
MGARIAYVSHGRDGYQLRVMETPWRILLISRFLEHLNSGICVVTAHRLFCAPPDWTFRAGWGRPQPGDRDYDPEFTALRHSLGWALCGWHNRMLGYGWRKEKELLAVPVTEEQVTASFPEWRSEEGDLLEGATPALAAEPGTGASRVKRKDYRKGRILL